MERVYKPQKKRAFFANCAHFFSHLLCAACALHSIRRKRAQGDGINERKGDMVKNKEAAGIKC